MTLTLGQGRFTVHSLVILWTVTAEGVVDGEVFSVGRLELLCTEFMARSTLGLGGVKSLLILYHPLDFVVFSDMHLAYNGALTRSRVGWTIVSFKHTTTLSPPTGL